MPLKAPLRPWRRATELRPRGPPGPIAAAKPPAATPQARAQRCGRRLLRSAVLPPAPPITIHGLACQRKHLVLRASGVGKCPPHQ